MTVKVKVTSFSKNLDTSTTDEMFSGQLFAILAMFKLLIILNKFKCYFFPLQSWIMFLNFVFKSSLKRKVEKCHPYFPTTLLTICSWGQFLQTSSFGHISALGQDFPTIKRAEVRPKYGCKFREFCSS